MLKDFTVIEIRKAVGPMNIIIEPKKVRAVRHVVEALEYAPYVQFLVNAKAKKVAIQVCKEKNAQALRFSKPQAEQGTAAVLIQNESLLATIRGIMPEWDPNTRYSVRGVYSSQDKAVIFDLTEATPYYRGSRNKPGPAQDMEEEAEE